MAFKIFFKNLFYFLKSVFEFWLKDSFLFLKANFEKTLRKLEKTFAIKVNFHYLFSPLYQDYTPIGYFFGFLVRAFKIIFGLIFYFLIFLAFVLLYLFILLLPFFFLFPKFFLSKIF